MVNNNINKLIDFFTEKPYAFKHAIKTSIAAIFTIIIYQYFNLPDGYWAVITCVVIMQSNIDSGSLELTINLAKRRLIGTASGACVGLILTYMIGPGYWWLLPIIFILIISGSYLTLLYKGFNLFGPTAVIIILLSHQTSITESLAFYRTSEIMLGVIVALVVTITLWPYRLADYLENNIKTRIEPIRTQFTAVSKMISINTFENKWLYINKTLSKRIDADQKYLGHLNSLTGELKNRTLLSLNFEKKLMDDLNNIGSSMPKLPNAFLKSKFITETILHNIHMVIKSLDLFYTNVDSTVSECMVNDLKSSREELFDSFSRFRKDRKILSDDIYSLDESYAAFSFIQAIVSSSKTCDELFGCNSEL